MNNSKQNKPEPQECNKCKASLLRGRVVVNGEAFCKTCAPEPPEPWEESFDENYPTGLYVRHETCDCCGLEPTPPEEVTEDVKAFIRKVHDQAYERGKKEGVMIAFNLIDDSAPKFEEEAKKTDDGETWLLARSLRRVRKWLNLELPKYLTKPSSD